MKIQKINQTLKEALEDDMQILSSGDFDEFADEIELEQAEEFPKVSSSLGHYTEIVNAINGEWETINDYNIIIANLKEEGNYEDIINVIKDIQDEEYKHVGQLQEILKTFSDDADNIQSGEEEAEKQMEGEDIQ